MISVVIAGAMINLNADSGDISPQIVAGSMALIIPLHLFSMFCIIHTIYFVAKAYKIAETQRAVTFSDFVGEFFLAWFFIIGVWIMQPKINTMVNEQPEKFS